MLRLEILIETDCQQLEIAFGLGNGDNGRSVAGRSDPLWLVLGTK